MKKIVFIFSLLILFMPVQVFAQFSIQNTNPSIQQQSSGLQLNNDTVQNTQAGGSSLNQVKKDSLGVKTNPDQDIPSTVVGKSTLKSEPVKNLPTKNNTSTILIIFILLLVYVAIYIVGFKLVSRGNSGLTETYASDTQINEPKPTLNTKPKKSKKKKKAHR